jgi:hypothetical protein
VAWSQQAADAVAAFLTFLKVMLIAGTAVLVGFSLKAALAE